MTDKSSPGTNKANPGLIVALRRTSSFSTFTLTSLISDTVVFCFSSKICN